MAEFILKALVKAKGLESQYYIESAAVSTEETGNPIYPPAKRCLNQHGVWFDPGKRARQVIRADYGRFDRIICMDASNLRLIKRIIPEDPEGKIHLMMSYAGISRDVADPWYTDYRRPGYARAIYSEWMDFHHRMMKRTPAERSPGPRPQ